MEIITRQEAKDAGLTRYFINTECVNGHRSERWTRNGGCIECGLFRNLDDEAKEKRRSRERKRGNRAEARKRAANIKSNDRAAIKHSRWSDEDLKVLFAADEYENYIYTAAYLASELGRTIDGIKSARSRYRARYNKLKSIEGKGIDE